MNEANSTVFMNIFRHKEIQQEDVSSKTKTTRDNVRVEIAKCLLYAR